MQMSNFDRSNPWRPDAIAKKINRALQQGMTAATVSDAVEPSSGSRQDFPHTDAGNAELMAAENAGHLKYADGLGWYYWDGRHWIRDDRFQASLFALNSVRGRQGGPGSDWYRKSESKSRLQAMLDLARPYLAISPDDFDKEPYSLNCRNGIVDLRTGQIRPHTADALHTKFIDIDYEPDARAEEFEKFLLDIFCGDREVVAFIQRAVGYSLTGSCREQVMLILYGGGSNGKSTFMETVAEVFGDYAQNAPSSMLLLTGPYQSVPADVARLRGARFVTMAEINQGRRLNESLVKQLTGGDKITARFMRENFFEFSPTHVLWMATNYKPDIHGTDDGIWRRILLVPFDRQFVDRDPAAGQLLKNPALRDALKQEREGILAWAIRGAGDYLKIGLRPPPVISEKTQEYRTDSDQFQAFVDACCTVHNSLSCQARDLYDAYKQYCEANVLDPMNFKRFGLAVADHGFPKGKVGGVIVYRGLKAGPQDDAGEPTAFPSECRKKPLF